MKTGNEDWLLTIWNERLQTQLVFDVDMAGQVASKRTEAGKKSYLKAKKQAFVRSCREAGFQFREIGPPLRQYVLEVLAEAKRVAALRDADADCRVERGGISARARKEAILPSRDGTLIKRTVDVGSAMNAGQAEGYWRMRKTTLRQKLERSGWPEAVIDAEMAAFEAVVRAEAVRRKALASRMEVAS